MDDEFYQLTPVNVHLRLRPLQSTNGLPIVWSPSIKYDCNYVTINCFPTIFFLCLFNIPARKTLVGRLTNRSFINHLHSLQQVSEQGQQSQQFAKGWSPYMKENTHLLSQTRGSLFCCFVVTQTGSKHTMPLPWCKERPHSALIITHTGPNWPAAN